MCQAVHRLQDVLLPLDLHRRVQVVPVEIPVSTRLPQVHLGNMRRVDKIVASLGMLRFPEILDSLADQGTLRVPANQPRANLVVSAEKVELPTQLPVVSLGSLSLAS